VNNGKLFKNYETKSLRIKKTPEHTCR